VTGGGLTDDCVFIFQKNWKMSDFLKILILIVLYLTIYILQFLFYSIVALILIIIKIIYKIDSMLYPPI
jgi:hypothetical protein